MATSSSELRIYIKGMPTKILELAKDNDIAIRTNEIALRIREMAIHACEVEMKKKQTATNINEMTITIMNEIAMNIDDVRNKQQGNSDTQ